MIQWKDDYSTGVVELDEQHKDLFGYCNDLEGILRDGDISQEMLEYGIEFLGEYVENHFGHEETCMHIYSCPIAGKNKIAHRKFTEAFITFEKRIGQKDNSYRILRELHTFLESWLVEHIVKIDTRLKPCVPQ